MNLWLVKISVDSCCPKEHPYRPAPGHLWDLPTLPQPRNKRVNAGRECQPRTICLVWSEPSCSAGETLFIRPAHPHGTYYALFPPLCLLFFFFPLQILAMIKDLTHNVPKLIYTFNSYLVRDCHGHNGARQTLLIPHGALSPGRERDIYAIIIQISTDCVMVPCRGWWGVAVVEPVAACTWAPGWASVPRLWI